MSRQAALALVALAVIVGITAAWWALALWPDPATPDWLQRTRAVCFGVAPGGLPSLAGWISLVGEPIGMFGFLFAVWGGNVREGLRALRRTIAGRVTLGGTALVMAAGLVGVGMRVSSAFANDESRVSLRDEGVAGGEAPPLVLVTDRGDTLRLASLRGRPVVLTFAYGHCQTVCPTLVRDAVRAVKGARGAPMLLVVTLDPWRDTPARLPSLHAQWALPADARILGGTPESVTRVLDAWGVARARSMDSGDIAHSLVTFVIGADGRVARRLSGTGDVAAVLRSL